MNASFRYFPLYMNKTDLSSIFPMFLSKPLMKQNNTRRRRVLFSNGLQNPKLFLQPLEMCKNYWVLFLA